MARMENVTPEDVYYWCPASEKLHLQFHSSRRGGTCMNCGVVIYDPQDGTSRWKARLPYIYIIAEDDELASGDLR